MCCAYVCLNECTVRPCEMSDKSDGWKNSIWLRGKDSGVVCRPSGAITRCTRHATVTMAWFVWLVGLRFWFGHSWILILYEYDIIWCGHRCKTLNDCFYNMQHDDVQNEMKFRTTNEWLWAIIMTNFEIKFRENAFTVNTC